MCRKLTISKTCSYNAWKSATQRQSMKMHALLLIRGWIFELLQISWERWAAHDWARLPKVVSVQRQWSKRNSKDMVFQLQAFIFGTDIVHWVTRLILSHTQHTQHCIAICLWGVVICFGFNVGAHGSISDIYGRTVQGKHGLSWMGVRRSVLVSRSRKAWWH